MDSQVIHTPIKHIGYHKSSKSQVNILSSSPDVALTKKGTYINVIDSMLSFIKERERNDTVDDGFQLNESSNNTTALMKENQRLKTLNQKIKNKISHLENKRMNSHSNTTDGVFTNQSNPKIEAYLALNKDLKKRNSKLKEKLKELEIMIHFPIVNILDKKEDIEIKLKSTILNMQNFLSLLSQTEPKNEVVKSHPIATNNSLSQNEFTNKDNNDIRNITNFSEAENLNTSLEEENGDSTYKNPLSEQQTANGNKNEVTSKPFEPQPNVIKKKEMLSSSVSSYFKSDRNEIFLSQRQTKTNKFISSGVKAKINIKRERKLSNILKYK